MNPALGKEQEVDWRQVLKILKGNVENSIQLEWF
jgi:hypothetical protein